MTDEKRGETFVMRGESRSDPAAPPLTFDTFLLGLASSALIHLGVTPHPETGKPERDLTLARQSLDLLSMLREKTRGNLTAQEEKFFDTMLSDLRLRFVEVMKR